MKTQKLLLGIVLGMMLVSLCAAEIQTIGPFKQNTCVQLPQICANCTYNNVTTMIMPNGTRFPINSVMTKAGSDYTYKFCNTDSVGKYIVNGEGDANGNVVIWNYDFNVTETGVQDYKISEAILLIMAILVGYAFIIFGIKGQDFVAALLGSMILMGTSIYIVNNGFANLAYNNFFVLMLNLANFGFASYVMLRTVIEFIGLNYPEW